MIDALAQLRTNDIHARMVMFWTLLHALILVHLVNMNTLIRAMHVIVLETNAMGLRMETAIHVILGTL